MDGDDAQVGTSELTRSSPGALRIPATAPTSDGRHRSLSVLGIDIGGTKIELALVDAGGVVLRSHRIPTGAERGAVAVVADAAQAAREAFGTLLDAVPAVGISIAGQIGTGGVLLGAPNLGWPNFALQVEVERVFARPAVVVNDVRAATWAEWRCGAGRGADDFVVLFIGTGVGGGAVIDGRMLVGASGVLGEFGHMTLVAGGRQCHCRNRGCLEAYASGWAIAERAREAVAADAPAGALLVQLAGGAEHITAHTVSEANRAGDALAVRLVRETGEWLGAGLVSLINAFNPQRLILGGGIIDGFPQLVPLAETFAREHALPAALADLSIVPARLANNAPAIGAAVVARHALEQRAVGTTR
ncbi:MAG TPA: ROK family protein [Gemmatimonadaceae bacterium]|nr:ROK family protein [Gemmatimonadaceae bacterium]